LRDRHGGHARAAFDLAVPLAHEATAMRVTDTAGNGRAWSGAVTAPSDRRGDVNRTNDRRTPATTPTPGTRTSTTATRTTTTRTTSSAHAPSADPADAGFSFEDLVAAYFDCRTNKRRSPSALAFERDLERNLVELHAELAGGTYRPGRSICFVILRPKPREVWAAAFRDRIVHHLLYNRIGERFERTFIADSCACIEGRGTLYAARRLEAKVGSITRNWQCGAYYLKADLANFFISIDKRILGKLLDTRIREPHWRELARLVLWHDPRTGALVQSPPDRLALIPPHKRLDSQPAHLGLPIGNLSSQFFANVYLDVLDRFVKHELRAEHYIRYVDDFVLLHASPQQLNAWRAAIAAFLSEALGVRLNDSKTILQPIARGIDFVGQVVKPWRRTIRRRTVHAGLQRAVSTDTPFETANSYFGLLRQATHSHRDRARLANVVRRRGLSVDHNLIKAHRGA
jgi:retron-type reverse transcriptase